MRPARSRIHHDDMAGDLLALVLGIVCFAVLWALMEGIDRV